MSALPCNISLSLSLDEQALCCNICEISLRLKNEMFCKEDFLPAFDFEGPPLEVSRGATPGGTYLVQYFTPPGQFQGYFEPLSAKRPIPQLIWGFKQS